jgi:hypothetical protein
VFFAFLLEFGLNVWAGVFELLHYSRVKEWFKRVQVYGSSPVQPANGRPGGGILDRDLLPPVQLISFISDRN